MPKSLLRPLMAAGLLTSTVAVHAQTPPLAVPPAVAPVPITAPAPVGDQVVIELRVVSVGGEVAGKLFDAKDAPACDPKSAKPTPVFLTAEQMKTWLELVQTDRRCTVMQAPKVTVPDGQSANVAVLDTAKFTTGLDVRVVNGNVVYIPKDEKVELGTTFRVSGTLSADKKHVKLGLKYHDKRLAGPQVKLHPVTTMVTPVFEGGSQGQPIPFTQFIQQPTFRETAVETAATVPDGGTIAVRAGKRTVHTRSEFGPPVLSQIPYLNRLFKNTGIAEVEQDVVVLATARRIPDLDKTTGAKYPAPPWMTATPAQAVYIMPAGATTVRAAAPADDLVSLLSAYRAACAAGKKDEAARLAVQALAKDPTCFAGPK